MKRAAILLAFVMALPAFAGRVITYTASSAVSQEDANNAAMAGSAKQIVSQVDSKQTMIKKESGKNGQSKLDETFFSSNSVKSNIKLKGVSLETLKAEKGFMAKASLDIDEFTADIQFRMNRIKADVQKLEASARDAIKKRLYGQAANNLQSAQDMLPEHERLLWQLSKIYPLNDSHRLVHNLPEVETILLGKLSGIKLRGPAETFVLTKSEMPEWSVTVSDEQGLLPGFPLTVRQGRQVLSEKRTGENGNATFLLRKVNFESGPYSLTVLPNLPAGIMKASGLDQGIEITYKVKLERCEVQMECNQIANLCSALESSLNKKSIFTTSAKTAPKLSVSFSALERNTLDVGGSTLKSYDIAVDAKGEKVSFHNEIKGVGKNELDATIKAVQKMDFSSLQKQLKTYCK